MATECTQQAQQSEENAAMRVMVCVDNSPDSEQAFQYYVDHIHHPDHEVIVLHVSDQVKMPTYSLFTEGVGFSPEEMQASVEALRKRNKDLEHKFNQRCNDLQVKHKVLVVSQDPHGTGQAIVEEAKKHHARLIVVGSRGLGTIRRTILGSISTYVIHHSHIPTLVCPVPKQHHSSHHHSHHHH